MLQPLRMVPCLMGTKILRIENERGGGPYQSIYLRWGDEHNDMSTHPLPSKLGWRVHRNNRFGFSCPEALHIWFSDEDLNMLRSNGFRLSYLDVDASDIQVCDTSGQVMYWHPTAQALFTSHLTTFQDTLATWEIINREPQH